MMLHVVTSAALGLQLPSAAPAHGVGVARFGTPHAAAHAARAGPLSMTWGVDIAPWKLEYGLQAPRTLLPKGARERGCPEPFAITDAQRKALLDDGAVVIPGLLSSEWLAYLRGATEWQVACVSRAPLRGRALCDKVYEQPPDTPSPRHRS
jgi:hypothetical protein